MDTQSSKTYKTIKKFFPYIFVATIMSGIFNYLIMNAMVSLSPVSLGWPFKGGYVVNGIIYLDIFGLVSNFLVWIVFLAITIPFLLYLFVKRK